jgi:hypothetical protein
LTHGARWCQATLLRHCVLEESVPNAEMQEIQGNSMKFKEIQGNSKEIQWFAYEMFVFHWFC